MSSTSFSVIASSGSGRYDIPREQLTIFEALAMCGDLSLYDNRKKIHVIRQVADSVKVMEFDLRSKSIIDSEFYYIQPNDVIYIPFDSAKHWGATHFTSVLSMTFATISFGMFVYSLMQKTKISLQICIKGEQMIKGVNHQVVEVSETDCDYFERILFFIKPECASVSEGKIRERASLIANKGQKPPSSKIKRESHREKIKPFLFLLSAASNYE